MRRYESDRHSEYRTRIDRVIAHIDGHLGEDLSLAQLAQIACFSEYHFHRLFRGIVGETLNEFVQRRRLETAARDLYLNPKAKVIDVALNTGYENPASFFKAFRRQFSTSPSLWRKQAARQWIDRLLGQKNALRAQNSKIGNVLEPQTWEILKGKDNGPMDSNKVEIRDFSECRIVYRRYTGRYGNPAITQMWGELMNWTQAKGLMSKDSTFIGILHDDPSITSYENCRYDACLVVSPEFRDTEALIGHFRGGKYLTFDFIGTPDDIDPAWDRVYGDFIINSGYLADGRPNIEMYPPNSVIDPEKMIFRSKLCVSIKDF